MKILSICILVVFLTACAPFMAHVGHDDPNLNLLAKGTPRSEIVKHFGSPELSTKTNEGYFESHKLEFGNKVEDGWAIGWLVADILTGFQAEWIGTPVEYFRGYDKIVNIKYNANYTLKSYNIQ